MEKKDWLGDYNSIYKILGASNHTARTRECDDYYATDPSAIDSLVANISLPQKIWECACGEGHLSERLKSLGYTVFSSDLVDRGYGIGGVNFLLSKEIPHDVTCILTNPPYRYAAEFVIHALHLLPANGLCCMFLKTLFLEGKARYDKIYSITPPKFVFQFSSRVLCAKNGDFDKMRASGGSAISYAWFVWEKGYVGDTVIRWI